MINLLKKIFLKFRKRKFLIKDDLKRQKIDYIFNYLLSNYENELRGKIDLPAFCYANSDIEEIIKMGKVDFAYRLIKRIVQSYVSLKVET